MATFQKRGQKWRAIVRRNGIRQSKSFEHKRDAEHWARQLEHQLTLGSEWQRPSPLSVAMLIERYLKEVSPRKKSHAVEKRILDSFLKRFPQLAALKIHLFQKEHIVFWRDCRLNQVKESTVLREWSLLSAIFSHAIYHWALLNKHPFRRLRRPRAGAARRVRIAEGDIVQLAAALQYSGQESPQQACQWAMWAFFFALETACRLGEICALRPEDVRGSLLHLRQTKNGSDRHVPLSREALRLLSLIALPLPHSAPQISKIFSQKRPPHLRHLHFHDSRHEALSRLAQKIPNPMTLAKISGHKDLNVLLNVYYHPEGKDLLGLLD